MRILPDSPHLDYLRQEAKHLLAALREHDPTATLSQAQRAVAEQYGFRGWPDLKAEVDRRRASARPADPALAHRLAEAFDLGAVRAPMQPVTYAFMGRRWRLRTERGDWLVGPVFDWIGAEQAALAAQLRERARAVGVAAPEPVRAADGELIKHLDGHNWRVDRWMEFGPEVLQPVRTAVAREVGRTLARLHGIGMPTDATLRPGQPGHLTQRASDEDFDRLIDRSRAADAPWLAELIRFRDEILPPLTRVPYQEPAEPFRICINDLNIGAVRMAPNGGIVCVHWEFAGANQRAWELAYVLRQWAGEQRANPGTARAIADGYRDVAGSLPDLDASAFWITITASLNWVHDRLSRALAAPGEQRDFSVGALQSELTDPFSWDTIERILAEL